MSGLKNYLKKKIKPKNYNGYKLQQSMSKNSSQSTKSIDDGLQKVADDQNRTLNSLLLGAGGGGKSTIMKQMERVYDKELNTNLAHPDFQRMILKKIHKNVMCDTIDLCKKYLTLKSQMTDFRFKNSELEEIAFRISSVDMQVIPGCSLSTSFAADIKTLWASPVFRQVFDILKKAHIMDNVPYFFDDIMKYASSNYKPTFEDYVRVRDRTTGIDSCKFEVQGLNTKWIFHAIDVGGQRSERRKWLKVLHNMNVVYYVMSLAAYDQVLYEDNTQRCWDESFSLFEQTINHKAFESTDFIVLLNKCDLFADKLKSVSFMTYINGNKHGKSLAIVSDMNNDRACLASSAMKHARKTSKLEKKRVSNGWIQKHNILAHGSNEFISVHSLSDNISNSVVDEKSDFAEEHANSPSAVINWTKKRFSDIFYASHGGRDNYDKHHIAIQRTINFHVTCATDEQQIQTVINIVQIQMMKRMLNRNLQGWGNC